MSKLTKPESVVVEYRPIVSPNGLNFMRSPIYTDSTEEVLSQINHISSQVLGDEGNKLLSFLDSADIKRIVSENSLENFDSKKEVGEISNLIGAGVMEVVVYECTECKEDRMVDVKFEENDTKNTATLSIEGNRILIRALVQGLVMKNIEEANLNKASEKI